jgi:cytochrome P450
MRNTLQFLVTGEETTSTALCWLLKFLSENDKVQERLYAELMPVMPSPDERPVGFRDVNGKLPCKCAGLWLSSSTLRPMLRPLSQI